MNGVHDMGGQQGMGPVEYEKNEPVFHAPWEGRIYALNRAMRAWRKWSLDAERHALELLPPVDYLRMSYYERWAVRLAAQVVNYGLVTTEEMESGKAAPGSTKATPALSFSLATSSRWLNRGIASSQDPRVRPLFKVRQRVRARNINPAGHTRLPRYARGKTGVIVRDHGVYVFPDTNAHVQGEKRQHVYSVRFAARELWGEHASPRDSVHLDMWDDYLEPA
jgi:nitrile hydratase beta subunit